MKGDIKTIQRRVNEREWDGITKHRIESVRHQFNSEVYTLETWLDNNSDSIRVGQQLDDLVTLLKTMRMMTNSTADSSFLTEQIEDVQKIKHYWE